MANPKALQVKVASGIAADGSPWSLWWPSWQWDRLTVDERRQVIERQAALMRGQSDGKTTSI